jgi:hypothetical protein
MRNLSRHIVILGTLLLLAPGLFGAERARSGERYRLAESVFDALERASLSTPVELRGIPLGGALVETMLVQEFEVFSPDARIHVIDGDVVRIEGPPAMRFFKGEVLGHPGSFVVLTQGELGIGGLINLGERVYAVQQDEDPALPRYVIRRVDDAEVPESIRNWTCEADRFRVGDLQRERGELNTLVSDDPVTGYAFTTSTKRRLRIAVDTDFELTGILGSVGAVASYVASVTAAVSVIYENDLNTVLHLGDVFTYASAADPWTATDSVAQLSEVGTYWHNTPERASISRSTVVFISGKNTGGGVAWLGVLCRDSDFEFEPGKWGGGYAVWGSVSGLVNSVLPNALGYWDVLAFAHELGHNANSDHTHCTPSTGFGRTFVDYCHNGESGRGCWAGAQTTPTESGTIMSYCHLLGGGYSNVRMIFGQAGEASQAILPIMKTHIDSKTLSGTLTAAGTTVASGSSGNSASFTVSGATNYVWEITNGTITGGQGTATLTYTAGAAGVVDFKVTAANSKGCGVIGYGSIDIMAAGSTHPDFNGDGKPDLVWRHAGSGENAIWLMNGATYLSGIRIQSVADSNWRVVAAADFNGDGHTDLLWRNFSDGRNSVWFMQGGTYLGGASLLSVADTNWEIGGVADFNGDGKPDLLWRNVATGRNTIWLMNGTVLAGSAELLSVAGSHWRIEGTGDLNGNGHADIVWRNYATGQNAIWFMNGTTYANGAHLNSVTDLNWKIEAVGDFNQDGKADLVWRNYSTGQNAIWYMSGAQYLGGVHILSVTDLNWILSAPR